MCPLPSDCLWSGKIDLENITAASGSSKLRGSVNKAERRKKTHKHLHLMSEPEEKKKGEKINTLTPREGHCRVYEIPNNNHLYKLPEAHDSVIWADTTYYRLRVMDVVCLFCGQFAELMVFAVRYERKQNGIIWRLSFLPTSFVQYCGAIQFNHESREM